MKLIAADRQNKIIETLNNNGSMKIAQLAQMFEVSKETIRRDLLYLNEIGAVKKSHGGALTSEYEFNTVSLESRIDKNIDIKQKLCKKAADYLVGNSVIFIDTGSTMQCMAQLLSQMSGYTIITNSLNAANVLINSNNKTLLTGGQLNPQTMAVDGFQTTSFLEKIKVDVAFLGTNGFEQHNGPTGTDFSDIQTKQTIIGNAKISIVVTESRKNTYSALMQYASWRDIDHLITDSDLSPNTISILENMTSLVLV